jgi:hypothetical protein
LSFGKHLTHIVVEAQRTGAASEFDIKVS